MTDLFEEKAEDWDRRERVKALSAAIGRAIVENIALHEDMEVMDFGAGTGLISSQVAPRVRRIVAVDTSQAMLDKLKAKPELRDKVETVCRDITRTPLDTRFDLIMSAMAVHHVADTGALFKRFADHMKPGGMVALADLDKEDGSFHPPDAEGVFHHGFERSQVEALLLEAGLKEIRFVTAHTVKGDDRVYPVFLVIARK